MDQAHMELFRHHRITLTWNLQGKSKQGRAKETWRKMTESERQQLGLMSWNEGGGWLSTGVNGEAGFLALFSCTRKEGTKLLSQFLVAL